MRILPEGRKPKRVPKTKTELARLKIQINSKEYLENAVASIAEKITCEISDLCMSAGAYADSLKTLERLEDEDGQ